MKIQSGVVMSAVVAVLLGGFEASAYAEKNAGPMASTAQATIDVASVAVNEARSAIENGKQLIGQIPANSELIHEVKEMLGAAAVNWAVAVEALEGAKASADKVASAATPNVAEDYQLLSKVNAYVAWSGANVVKTALIFVEAAANNKTEALDIIRMAMHDSLAASAKVRFNYELVKTLIAEKYAN